MLAAVVVSGLLVSGAGTAAAAGVSSLTSAGTVSPVRAHGLLKVYDDVACTDEAHRRVVDTFSVGGRRFQPDQPFTLTFRGERRGMPALTVTGTTSDEGTFCLGPQTLPAGRFLVTYVDESGKRRAFRQFVVLPTRAEPSTPPVKPEPTPAKPEPSTPPAKPEPSTPPAKPKPSTPPATPQPSTAPAKPKPSGSPAKPARSSSPTPVRTPRPQALSPSPAQTQDRSTAGLGTRTSKSPTKASTPTPTPRATDPSAGRGDDDVTSDKAGQRVASDAGDVEETLVAVPVGLSERTPGSGASAWVLALAALGVVCAMAWCVFAASREE